MMQMMVSKRELFIKIIFTTLEIMMPINPIKQILPALDKSAFVTSPYIAIIAKTPAVIRKIVKTEAGVYTNRMMEKTAPVK